MSLREFDDRSGTRWTVWDTVPETTTGLEATFRGGWLTFDSGAERRRLGPVPDGWTDFPPERLDLLLRVAREVTGPSDADARLEEDRRVAERRTAVRRVGERRGGSPIAPGR